MSADSQTADDFKMATATVVCKKEDIIPVPAKLKMRFLADRLILSEARKRRQTAYAKLALPAAELNRLHFAVRENAYIFQNDSVKIVVELAPRQSLSIQAFEHGAPRSIGHETTEAIHNYLTRRSILRPTRVQPVEMFWDASYTDKLNSVSEEWHHASHAPTVTAEELLLTSEESFAIETALKTENERRIRDALNEFHGAARVLAVLASRNSFAESAQMTLELAFAALTADVSGCLRERDMPKLVTEAIAGFDPVATARATLSRAYAELAAGSDSVSAVRISLSAKRDLPGIIQDVVKDSAWFKDTAAVTLESAYAALMADLTPRRIRLHSVELAREIGSAIDNLSLDVAGEQSLALAYASLNDLADGVLVAEIAVNPANHASLSAWTLHLNESAADLQLAQDDKVEIKVLPAVAEKPALATEPLAESLASEEPLPVVMDPVETDVIPTEKKSRIGDPEVYRELGLKIAKIVSDITTAYRVSDIHKGFKTLEDMAREHTGILDGMDVPEFTEACRRSFRAIIQNEKLFIDDLDESVLGLGIGAGMDDELVKLQIADKALAIFLNGLALDSSPHLKKSRADKIRHLGILTTRKVMMKSSKYLAAKGIVIEILTHEAKVTDKAKRNNELVETYAYLTHWMEGV